MGLFQRIFFLFFFTTVIFSGYTQSVTDSLTNEYLNSSDVKTKLENCINLIDELIYIDSKEANSYLAEAKNLAKKSGSKKLEEEVLLTQYEELSFENKDDEAAA